MLLLSILWVLVLFGVLSRAAPGVGYPRELEQRVIYYGVWLLMVGLLVLIHYHLMAGVGHGPLAVLLDVGVVGAYGLCQGLRCWLRTMSNEAARFDLKKLPRPIQEIEGSPAYGTLCTKIAVRRKIR